MIQQALTLFSLGIALVVGGTSATAAAASFPRVPVRRCAPNTIVAGTVCLDAYEASVWRVPDSTTTNAPLVRLIQVGRVSESDLLAAGALHLGIAGDDYAPCADNGENCFNDIYAVSLPSEVPSANLTWFQAQEACANAGKRLPTSAEWQVAANGTPDPGPDNGTTDCNTAGNGSVTLTGARTSCVSARGAFDMVGNLVEWVADWVPLSTTCPNWGSFSDDFMCLSGASVTANGPGALLRGGSSIGGPVNGPLMILGTLEPSRSVETVGFRCAR
jgi:formylglycine-generating enzyme required for sulfatase activity